MADRIRRAKVMFVVVDSKSRVVAFTDLIHISVLPLFRAKGAKQEAEV